MKNKDVIHESLLSKSVRSYVIKNLQKLQDKGYKIIIRGSDCVNPYESFKDKIQ